MGFAGGQMLEPGMGVGLFNGLMPVGMASSSTYTGVEYDTITGNIARLLYPESNMIVGDFAKTKLPRDYFDAAIGNPPFGQIKIQSDPEYRKQGFLLHDYFFAKTIDRVKPGGLLVFVTSAGTMNKASDRARSYLADRADLVGAVRLPQTAFKDNAGTEVVTDVIFLRKRDTDEERGGEPWLNLKEVSTPQGATQINEYFVDHPEMVLGRHALTGSMYRANTYTVEPIEGDIEQQFSKAIENLPENIYRAERGSAGERAEVQRRDYDPKIRKEGGVYVADDGTLMQVDSGAGVPLTTRRGSSGKDLELKPKELAWLRGYVELRDALKQSQFDQLNEGDWESSLAKLQQSYDAFTKKHGPILKHSVIEREQEDGTVLTTRRFANDPLLRLDAEGALAYALENITPTGEIEKSPVLLKRTLNKPKAAQITNIRDAMFVSLDQIGRFDLAKVAELAGKSEAETIAELGDAIYQQPGGEWTTADEYLSGNVVRRLREAEAAARTDKRYQRNVAALEAVQPRALAPQDITVQLGAGWIPPSDVRAFVSDAMGEMLDISYNPATADWHVGESATDRGVSEWGTPDRKPNQLLEAILNNRQIKIVRYDADRKPYTDPEATEAANEKARKIRTEFRRWIWTDDERTGRLVTFYNEHFNNIAPRHFDGSHLTLPGVSSLFSLRAHQKRAIWRTIQQGDVYYNHAVGAGKTFTAIASSMEERRLGLINKPMHVVPNHMLAQYSKEFLELYPAANIMVADEHNFHTHNRRRFIAQAALNDPDAIIITHSAFGKLSMSDGYVSRFLQNQINEWQSALDDVTGDDRITRKQIERRIEQLENRLEKLRNDSTKDKVLDFEQLGVDRLYVDEGHEFRKLDYATNQGSVKGIDSSGSQKAMDLSMKASYLREKRPGRALVMASGTAITNTMGELYTVQRYFQPDQLEEDGHSAFDAWATHYGEIVAGLEQNAAGGYETVSRFAKFVNVPELMARVRSFMDILTSDQLGDLVVRPAVDGGGRQVVVTPSPAGYKEYQKDLERRIKAIRDRKGPPKKGDDIILKVIADGRFSAIDMRFVDPDLPSDPESKLNVVITDMVDAYHESKDWEYHTAGVADPLPGGTMMLFTDIGLGEQSAASRGFDMKDWIRDRLIAGGVDPNHIAFMRDNKAHSKKERLFEDMRQGRKRILIGGKDMETGVNAQKRLAYLSHLDCPWFPASVEQREGRIVRQGNQNKIVRMRGYATKGSYDSTMWGMNARKARFIEQAMRGDASMRSMEDVSEASQFEMAAALASGDERYLKLAGLKGDVDRLGRLYSAHTGEQSSLKSKAISYQHHIRTSEKLIKDYGAALTKRERIEAGAFAGVVDGQTFDNRDEFSSALWEQFKHRGETFVTGDDVLGKLGGFDILYTGKMFTGDNFGASLELDVPGGYSTLMVWPPDAEYLPKSVATRAANIVNRLDEKLLRAEDDLRADRENLEKVQRRVGKAFPELSEYLEKTEELQSLEAELAASGDAAAATVEIERIPARSARPHAGAHAMEPARLFSESTAAAQPFNSAEQLEAHLRTGPLADVIGTLIDKGRIFLHDTPLDMQTAGTSSGTTAFYNGRRIEMAASKLSPDTALSVLLHEMFHGGVQPLIGNKAWSKLQNRLGMIYRHMQKNPGAHAEFLDGFARVQGVLKSNRRAFDQAQARGQNVEEPYIFEERWQIEEFGAYAAQHYQDAPPSLKRWVDDLITAVKTWLLRNYGLQFGKVTPAQLRALAVAALRDGQLGRNLSTPLESRSDLHVVPKRARDNSLNASGITPIGRYAELGSDPATIPQMLADAAAIVGFDIPFEVVEQGDIGQFVPMRFNLQTRQIEVNTAFPLQRGEAAQALVEEVLHGVDVVKDRNTLSASSKLLDLESGAIAVESIRHFESGGALAQQLAYPLMDRGSKSMPPDRLKAELFARLGVIYLGDPQLLREHLPHAYRAFDEIFGLSRESPVSDSWVFRRVWGRPALGAAEVGVVVRVSRRTGGETAGADQQGRASDGLGGLRRAAAGAIQASPLGRRTVLNELNTQDPDARYRPGGASFAAADAAANGDPRHNPHKYLKRAVADATVNWRPKWLKFLTRQQIVDVGKDILPQTVEFERTARAMDADANNESQKYQPAAELWSDWANSLNAVKRGAASRMAALMHQATLAGVDPDMPRPSTTPTPGQSPEEVARSTKRANAWDELKPKFAALPKELQELYRDVRDNYSKRRRDLFESLEARILKSEATGEQKRAMIDKLRKEFESQTVDGPYFPLARFGDFYVVAEKDGQRHFAMFETVQERRAALPALRADGWTIKSQGKNIKQLAADMGPSADFMADAMTMITDSVGGAEADSLKDGLWQMYLQSLPEASIRKHFIHRVGTPGFSRDALRAYASQMAHGSKQLARLRYGHQLANILRDMKRDAIASDDPDKAADIIGALNSSYEWMMNPTGAAWANRATSIGFLWYLGVSPAAAMVNLLQTPVVTLPVLGAKYGFAKAAGALAKAGNDYLGYRFNKEKKAAIEGEYEGQMGTMLTELEESGAIDRTQTMSLMGMSEDNSTVNLTAEKWMKKIGFLFHQAERMNREATAMAAYRLARDAGINHAKATQAAYDAIFESHFDYGSSNRAELMRSNMAKVLLLFKQYSQNMTYLLWRNAYQMFKGADAATRKEAAKKLAGITGMTFALAGTMGLPMASSAFWIANMVAGMFGDDDEPWDAELAFRQFLAEMVGPTAGAIIARGAANESGLDIASRTSLGELWVRSPGRDLEGKALALHYLEQAAGPVVGIGVNALQGLETMAQPGQFWRGAESLVPKFMRDVAKTGRYATEGVLNMRGDVVVAKEELGLVPLFMQASGFSPAAVSDTWEQNNQIKRVEQRILDRRKQLVNLWYASTQASDEEMTGEAVAMIQAFNAKNPELAITSKTLRQSMKARLRYSENAQQGIQVNPKLRPRLDEMRYLGEGV